MIEKPSCKPDRPYFSSGPCVKYLGWSPDCLKSALVGRSHRSQEGIERLQEVLKRTKYILGIPADYKIAITPGSATGAMEMALWNMIGERAVDILSWDVFGRLWVDCLQNRLNLKDIEILDTGPGHLPDLNLVDFQKDVVFTWNGSTTGVCLPDGKWIPADRKGLTFCDATSAAFAYDLPWDKLDVTVFSWQKALGGEAGQGMLILSPRAFERLKSYTPIWPIPLVLRLKLRGEVNYSLFDGFTLNTPSMLCLEDYLKALDWVDEIGGLPSLINRSKKNAAVVDDWLKQHNWIDHLAKDPSTRSHTGVCLVLNEEEVLFSNSDIQWGIVEEIVKLLEKEEAAFDIKNHRFSHPGFRFWCGPTVEPSDLKKALPWLEWGYQKVLEKK